MLFRTKFVVAFCTLASLAIGAAGLLIWSVQRSEMNQIRTDLAHENLSGYFQLSGSVFQTFKKARRDLLSGPGAFNFDFDRESRAIEATLERIAETSRAEAAFMRTDPAYENLTQFTLLREEVMDALAQMLEASNLIVAGRTQEGRLKATNVLEGQVDVRIANLIEEATTNERFELENAQTAIRDFQATVQRLAWIAALTAILLSVFILLTLVRRFRTGLSALDAGAQAYTSGDLEHKIDLPGQDELSDVANRFTGMAQQLLSKRKDLEEAQSDLEKRVSERTLELSEANAELRERDSLRREFFADIGHELRTPVTAIRGEAEVALRARSDPVDMQRAALRTIVSLSEDLTSSVSDLFLIARAQAGVLDFQVVPTDLNTSATLSIEQMQSLHARKEATITANLSREPVMIEGDQARISQLLRLLLSNALMHCDACARIDVATYVDGDDGVLEVCDDGPGIALHERPRIFERYVRGSPQAISGTSGTGLGLAIAKSITQAHGGRIAVDESTMGGARFTARFPIIKAYGCT